VSTLSALILPRLGSEPAFTRPTYILLSLLAIQVTLGICTVLLRKPADIASAHVAVGSLVLVTSWVITVRAFGVVRILNSSGQTSDAGLQYAGTND